MNHFSNDRTALFIDGANLYATERALGVGIDYKKLLGFYKNKCRLLRAFYYTSIVEDPEFSSIRPLLDWLEYNGFTMVTKPAKEYTDQSGRRKIKGSMDIELALDMLEMAPHIDSAILFSGNGDFTSLIRSVQAKGVRCSVVSTIRTNPPMIADELRRQADEFVELKKLSSLISRNDEDAPHEDAHEDEDFEESFEESMAKQPENQQESAQENQQESASDK